MTYISPVLGELNDSVYENFVTSKVLVKTKYDLDEFLKIVGFGRLRSGVLWVESVNKRLDIRGSELEKYLSRVGFDNSRDIVKLFATNQTLIDDLVSRGISLRHIIYELDLADRLKQLGLKSRSVTHSYAMDMLISVYPVGKVTEEVPPSEVCYRTQLAYMYVANNKGKGTPEVIAEFRVWGVSSEKGKYEISKFERVILQMERIFKGEGKKPIHWLASIDKIIKASEEDEEIDCDEAGMDLNYALRGAAFRGELEESLTGFNGEGKKYRQAHDELITEYNERWIKSKEKKMIEEGALVTRFDNEQGVLINVTDILKKEKDE